MKDKLQEAAEEFLIKKGVKRKNIAPEVLKDFAEFATDQSKEAIQELVSALEYAVEILDNTGHDIPNSFYEALAKAHNY